MADIDPTAILGSSVDAASAAIIPVIWSVLVIIGIMVAVWYFSFRHVVRIRLLTSQGSVPITDKAKDVKVDGVNYWKLFKRKDVIPIPASDCLVTVGKDWQGKHKFYVEMYHSEEQGYIAIKDKVTASNIDDKIQIVSPEGKVINEPYQPFTPQQRSLFIAQLRRAEARRKKSFFDQISQVATPAVLVILIVCILVFWEDVAKPAKDMAGMNNAMLNTQKEMLGQQAEISAQNARITQALTGEKLDIHQPVNAESIGGAIS